MSRIEVREAVTLENEGSKMFGILHTPIACYNHIRAPCVVMVHGLGGNKSGRYRMSTLLSEKLASQGLASLRFDCRGAGDSEGYFGDSTLQSLVSDVICALLYVSNHLYIDATRLALCGRSFGGLVALQAGMQFLQSHPQSIKACALHAAVYDGAPWTQSKHSEFSRFEEQLSQEFVTQFVAYDPKPTLLQLQDVPLLIVQGEKDQTVTSYHCKQYEAVRRNNSQAIKKTRVISLENSDHEFSNYDERQRVIQETVQFMKRYI